MDLETSSLARILHGLSLAETIAKAEGDKSTSLSAIVNFKIGLGDLTFPYPGSKEVPDAQTEYGLTLE